MIEIEHKGRTLHLLKTSSKPIPQQRKRRKIGLFGTFSQYKDSIEEVKHEESEGEMERSRRLSAQESLGGQLGRVSLLNSGGPNIIGNAEDVKPLQFNSTR